jgi:hypothetical protein
MQLSANSYVMKRTLMICFLLTGFLPWATGQVIDYASGFKYKSDKMLRLHFDNDYFTTTDRYYTYGITLEWAHPSLKASPLNFLLLKAQQSSYRYGLALAYFCYTPASLSNNTIRYGDRPFSGNLVLSSSLSSRDTLHARIITSFLTFGIIGQGAGGEETQLMVHRMTNNVLPNGWQFQIRNDLILTYQLNYEKRLTPSSRHLLLSFSSEARVGTHNDKLKAGFSFMAGRFNDPYRSKTAVQDRRKTHWYFYGQVQPALVLFDATLQGGLFNRKNPYTLPASDIRRITLQADYGIVLTLKKWYVDYCQSFLSPEFSGGLSHRWGGIRIGFDL